jgi:selenide, water dikinase
VPQEKLMSLLEGIGDGSIGMDCSIVASRHRGLFQVSTTDFFFPLVEDPYLQGRIACANVLSDLYALGVFECDNLLMLLCASTKMDSASRDIVVREMMRGFNDLAVEGGTKVTGGQTTLNPWPLIGGVAMSVCAEHEIIRPELACIGDVLVLTKPIGTQVAVNAHQWMDSVRAEWTGRSMDNCTDEQQVAAAYATACESMSRLNRNAARLMHKHGSHGATDVTGFGLIGHASNLAANQRNDVDFVIDTLPVIANMARIDAHVGRMFRLLDGMSAETSGGLLTAMPADAAQQFVDDLKQADGQPAWIIGRVVAGSKTARIVDKPTILEI